MIKIKKTNNDSLIDLRRCEGCNCSNDERELTLIGFRHVNGTCLCDECLQELNRKIVDHLAEKNL